MSTDLPLTFAERASRAWDEFYSDKERPVPFFANVPDESLAGWVEGGTLNPGKAIDLGCGTGRNAIFLARNGWKVDAVDFSPQALAWAQKRCTESGAAVTLMQGEILGLEVPPASYQLAYDSGFLHHVRPSLRREYLQKVSALLVRGGSFAVTAFAPESEAPCSDRDDDRSPESRTGWSFTHDGLRRLLEGHFEIVEQRRMREFRPGNPRMGESFLWVALCRRR